MSVTWIWHGDYERLERVMPDSGAAVSARRKDGDAVKPFGHWSEVNAGDAVFALSEHRHPDMAKFRGAWLLNAGAARAAAMDDEERGRIWQRAGLQSTHWGYVRLYLVKIVHLDPLEILRLDSAGNPVSGIQPIGKQGRGDNGNDDPGALWPSDAAVRRVVRTAVRALYALRLDIGEAVVALGEDGRTSVRKVSPLTDVQLRRAGLQRFARWYASLRNDEGTGAGQRRLMIGADPEFLLLKPDGKVASAARYLGESTGAAAGTDVLRVGRRLLYPVAELRPEPADNPAALAANVRQLLMRAAKRIGGGYSLRWAAGAMPARGIGLGGHIHFSGAPLTSLLLRQLDSYAAFPLALVEDPAGRGRRPRYGSLGDFRLQPHGFEYRTLPSWLVSPAAAKAAFALALLCAKETWSLSYLPSAEERYITAYYAGDRTALSACLDELSAALAATPSYAQYEAYIEPVLEAARRGTVWNEGADIRIKWRIPPMV